MKKDNVLKIIDEVVKGWAKTRRKYYRQLDYEVME